MRSVSVIIPCYNCAAFIGETLQSLTEQTCQDFEVICVNDGSKDETLSILEHWQKQGAFEMRIIDKPNGGVSSARNAGIRAAQGKYLLFLDADDLYRPEYIEWLCGAIEESGADVSYCRLNRDYDMMFGFMQKTPVLFQSQTEAMNNLLYRMGEFGFYCYLYKKDILARENIEFDICTRRFEDREFNWKYLCHCKSAAFVDAPLYFYRVNEDSVTQRKTIQWRTDGLEAVQRIEKYLEQRKCDFLPELKSYLFPRVMWAVAKNYALSKEKALFARLGQEYDVKRCMKRTARDSNKLVALASWLYLIHPMLFYYAIGFKK